jgi:hypothetical protein
MAKSGRSEPKKVNNKPAPPVVADKRLAQRMVTYTQSAIPVRTVIYMEVGDLPADKVRAATEQVAHIHGSPAHPTYIIPVRNQKMTGDVIFEQEILDMVKKICHVVDGDIVLRDGAQEIDVMRTQL